LPVTLKAEKSKKKDEALVQEEGILKKRKKCREFVKDSIIS